jgi:hypothetical protein
LISASAMAVAQTAGARDGLDREVTDVEGVTRAGSRARSPGEKPPQRFRLPKKLVSGN